MMSSDPPIRFRCSALRRSGATDIRVVHASNADAARERLIAAGLEPLTIEEVGPSLTSRLIARLGQGLPRPGIGSLGFHASHALTAARLLAAASVTLMLGAWTMVLVTDWRTDRLLDEKAARVAAYRQQLSDEAARMLARPALTEAGPTEVLGRLAAILPSDTGLVTAERDRKGALRIEIDTADPDQIRPLLAGDRLFGSLEEAGQAQTDEGRMRVTWASAPR